MTGLSGGTGYTRIEKITAERTGELAWTNRRLHFKMEEHQQAKAALRQAQDWKPSDSLLMG